MGTSNQILKTTNLILSFVNFFSYLSPKVINLDRKCYVENMVFFRIIRFQRSFINRFTFAIALEIFIIITTFSTTIIYARIHHVLDAFFIVFASVI